MYDFSKKKYWVFDLDQTLYPYRSNVIRQIDDKIAEYCLRFFQTDVVASHEIRLRLLESYGTTMSGLLQEKKFNAEEFLRDVHDVDYSELTVCERLKKAIAALPGKKIIYTNASRPHAERVLRKRELHELFDGMFDISASGYRAKPCANAFADFLLTFTIPPEEAVFFDDNLKNLTTAKQAGVLSFHVMEGETPDTQVKATDEFLTVYHLAEFLETAASANLNCKKFA